MASYLSWSCRCWWKVTTGRGQGSGETGVGAGLGGGCGGQELQELDHTGLSIRTSARAEREVCHELEMKAGLRVVSCGEGAKQEECGREGSVLRTMI